MILHGYDPSINNLGWCVWDVAGRRSNLICSGTYYTKKKTTLGRLAEISIFARGLAYPPDIVVIEKPWLRRGRSNPASIQKLAMSGAAIIGALPQANHFYIEGHPTKTAAYGIARMFGVVCDDVHEHEIDAVSIGYTFIKNHLIKGAKRGKKIKSRKRNPTSKKTKARKVQPPRH